MDQKQLQISQFNPKSRDKAHELLGLLQQIGIEHGESVVRSEIQEDKAQVVKYLILRSLWPMAIDSYLNDSGWIDQWIKRSQSRPDEAFADAGVALQRIIEAGVDPVDVGRMARAVAYYAAFQVLETIDEGYSDEVSDSEIAPRWVLMEADAQDNLTGRRIGELHALLLQLKPPVREHENG